jgi:hypothetical protein
MPDFVLLMAYEGEVFLLAFAALIVVQLLSGNINVEGLLRAKRPRRSFSPERLQLLITTGATSWLYIFQVLQDSRHLPAVPIPVLGFLGASHSLYLGLKFYRRHGVQ